MVSTSFSVFFLLSHLVLLHSAEEEKKNPPPPNCSPFTCGKLGLITFPFKDTNHSDCGEFMVNCSRNRRFQTIQLKKGGPWFDVTKVTLPPPTRLRPEITIAGYIKIHDRILEKQLQTDNCDNLNNFTSPNSLYSFSFLPNRNLVKCFSNPRSNQSLDVYFHGYSSYKDCEGYSIYYNNSNNPSMPSGPLPHNCSVIDLPTPLIKNSHDLFTLLPDEFLLGYHVYVDYHECLSKGGQCQHDSWGNFRCSNLKKGKNKLSLKLAIGIIVASAAGIGMFIVCCFGRKFLTEKFTVFWKKETPNHQNVEVFLKNYGSLAPKRYSYSDVKKMTNSFKEKLGQGGYGGVYKGKLQEGQLVAVKILNNSKGDGQDFVNEVASISKTSHVNIVTLLGFCFEGSKRALIYEFMPNGSLEKFIYDDNMLRENRQLGWETLYQIAIGIARGLEYLHRGCNTRILHFDIKPHNILLDKDFCPKVSDFGLAKLCPKNESTISMLGARGTAGYIAPEVFCRNFGRVSHKSDVYSYGMMVLEMVGGRKNFDAGINHTSEIYFPHWIYKRLEQGDQLGLHGIMNEEESEKARKMVLVSLWCIQTDPSNRPPMGAVVEMLQGSLESLQIPPRPCLSSPPRLQTDSLTTPIMTL